MVVVTDAWSLYATMFEDALERERYAPQTIRTYRIAVGQLGAFLRARGMPHDPTLVTREHLTEWLRHLHTTLAAQTVLQRYRSVSRLFAFLVAEDEIAESPMAKMKPPRVPERLVPVIGDDALGALFRAVSGTDFESRRDRAILSLFVDCGPRIAELAGLRLDDLDLEGRELVVTGKGSRARRVRFVRETRTDVQRYLLQRARHPDAELPWLWLGRQGRLTASGVYRMVVRRAEQAGIGRVHPHQFRHSAAHGYLSSGGNEGDLMELMGWKSRAMVSRYAKSTAGQRSRDAHDLYSPRKRVR